MFQVNEKGLKIWGMDFGLIGGLNIWKGDEKGWKGA